MYKNPLVSIVTPCYNGENKITMFLESVLNQTYDNIEIIFINDGSTDSTAEICKKFQERFDNKGYKFIYIEQENKGQAAAINTGLAYVTGKYLTWPDSDDKLHPEYIKKKVDYLENNPSLNMVISPIAHVQASTGKVLKIERRIKEKNDNFFIDLVIGRNSYYPPGGYMVTTKAFFDSYPDRKIAVSKIGQNVQMLLPIAYTHKYGYLDDILYDYYVYEDSHAHCKRTFEEAIEKSDLTNELFSVVMQQMKIPELEYSEYKKLLLHERYRRHFYYALQYKNKKYMNESYRMYKNTGDVLPKIWLLHIVRNIKM